MDQITISVTPKDAAALRAITGLQDVSDAALDVLNRVIAHEAIVRKQAKAVAAKTKTANPDTAKKGQPLTPAQCAASRKKATAAGARWKITPTMRKLGIDEAFLG